MIVSITGSSGFIGTALVRRLVARGDTVRVLTRREHPSNAIVDLYGRNVQIFRGDLLDADCELDAFVSGVDVLYNCAGEIRDPTRMHALHVEGTRRLAAAATGHVRHWVQLSSVGAYGSRDSGLVTEETPTAPVGPYETSKTLADELVAAAAALGAFRCTIVRPSNVIGPEMSNRSVFQLIAAIERRRFVFIGRPGAMANYVHVDNVIEALRLVGETHPAAATVYNVSDACSFENFVQVVCQTLRCAEPAVRIPKWSAAAAAFLFGSVPGFPLTPSRVQALTTRATYATGKIAAELNYCPIVPMPDAIAQMANAWKSNERLG